MQAFQELDNNTHTQTETSADYWKPPCCSHFNVLTGQTNASDHTVTGLISAFSVQSCLDPITSTPPPGGKDSEK